MRVGGSKALGAVEHIRKFVGLTDKLLRHTLAVGVVQTLHEEGQQTAIRIAQFFKARTHLPLAEHLGKGAQGFHGAHKLAIGQSREGVFAQGSVGG